MNTQTALVIAGIIVFAALCIFAFVRILNSLMRTHARERNLLLNQIMHLSGKTWEPPPSLPEQQVAQLEDVLLDPAYLPDDYNP